LAITPPVRVEPLFPPHPTSITLPGEKIKTTFQDFKISPQKISSRAHKKVKKRKKEIKKERGLVYRCEP
jgi:hypothetical protein